MPYSHDPVRRYSSIPKSWAAVAENLPVLMNCGASNASGFDFSASEPLAELLCERRTRQEQHGSER